MSKSTEVREAVDYIPEPDATLIRDSSPNVETANVVRHLAHELRQPLSTIESIAYYLDLILPADALKARQQVEKLQQLVEQSNWIVSDAVDFAQAATASPEPVDLRQLVSSAVALCGEPGPDVGFEGHERLVVTIDRVQGEHLFRNLFTFFWYAGTGGPVALRATTAEGVRHVLVEASAAAEGYSQQKLDSLFEPFSPNLPAERVSASRACAALLPLTADGYGPKRVRTGYRFRSRCPDSRFMAPVVRREFASDRKLRERNKPHYRLAHWPIWIAVFFLLPGPLTFRLFAHGFDWRMAAWLCLVLAGTGIAGLFGKLPGVEPRPYIIRFTEDKPNPRYRRICYTLAWSELVAYAALNIAGLSAALWTGHWRLQQIYDYAYFPIVIPIWILGALGYLPRVKRSTKGEGHERRYFYGTVWAVCFAQPVVWVLWLALPNTRAADALKLVVFVLILLVCGLLARRGLLPRTRQIVPGEMAVSD